VLFGFVVCFTYDINGNWTTREYAKSRTSHLADWSLVSSQMLPTTLVVGL